MPEEIRAKIAQSVKRAFEAKRLARPGGDNPSDPTMPAPSCVRMSELALDPLIFEPMKTGKPIDDLLSKKGGLTRATNFMIIGDPGVGKSTVAMDILSGLQSNGANVLFVSGEMDRIDLYYYFLRYPKFGDIDVIFLGEYLDHNPKLVIEGAFKKGYDAILIDSFSEVNETVKEALGMTASAAEKWLLDLMRSHNQGNNDRGIYTSFLCIQQVTKGGVFLGSNRLKHIMTGMMEIRFGEDGSRYLMFTKNRRGDVNKRMFFDLSAGGEVRYDAIRYGLDEAARRIFEEGKEELRLGEERFDDIFGPSSADGLDHDEK